MVAAWTVYINLATKSDYGLVTSRMARQTTLAQARVDALNTSMGRTAVAARAAGQALNVFGLAAAATMAIGLKGAIDLQKATIQAAIALGKTGDTVAQTTANMKEYRDVALSMSKITGQSLPESMGVIATMATAGVSGAQIKANWKPIAQFTDVLHFSPKDSMDYGEAAKLGAGLAHDLRLFNEKDLRFGFGEIARLGYLSPHGTVELATQVRQAAPGLENLLPGSVQDRARQIVDLTAWADRMGGLARFGTGISQLVTNMVAPRSARVRGAMTDLGVYDEKGRNRFFDQKTGVFDLIGALHQVAAHYQAASNLPGGRGQAVQSMMGLNANAARYLQLLSSKESLQAFAAVQRQQRAMGADPAAWLDQTQTQLMGELSTQTQLLTSNFKTLATLLADGFIAPLTKVVSPVAAGIGNANSYLNDHPRQAMLAGGALAAWGAWAVKAFIQSNMGHFFLHAFRSHAGLGGGVGVSGLGRHAAASAAERAALGVGAVGVGGGILSALGGLLTLPHLRAALGGMARWPGLGGAGSNFVRASAGVDGAFLRGFMADMAKGLNLTKLVEPLRLLGTLGGMATTSVRLFAEGLFKLGARAIPLVGEVLLVVDALKLLMTHSKDLGKVLGTVAGWIWYHGGPMLWKAITNVVIGGIPMIVGAFQSLMRNIFFVLNPANWGSAIQGFASSWGKAFAAQAPSAPARGGGHTSIHVQVNVNHKGTGNPAHDKRLGLNVARKTAQAVAEVMNAAARTGNRLGGAQPTPLRSSFYESAGAMN